MKRRKRHLTQDLEKVWCFLDNIFLESNKGSNTIILHFSEYFNKTKLIINPVFPFFVMNNSKMGS